MEDQIVRFVNYGTSLENLNLTSALQVVGIKAQDAAKNDVVYIVYEKDGKMLCSSRGVLEKEVSLSAFNWPQEQKYTSIWQIDGNLQFCDPFDLSVLKSQRDAAQYMWFIQNEVKIENNRILDQLNELFEKNKKNDGNLLIHETLKKLSVPRQKQQTKKTQKKFSFDKDQIKEQLENLKERLSVYVAMFLAWLRDESLEQFKKTDPEKLIVEQQEEKPAAEVNEADLIDDSPIDEEAMIASPALSHVQKIPNARLTDFNKAYAQSNSKYLSEDIDIDKITAEDLTLSFSKASVNQHHRDISEDESKFIDSLNDLEFLSNKNDNEQRSPEDFFNE